MGCLDRSSEDEGSEKTSFTDRSKLSRLKWNWFYVILASCLVSIGNSSPLGTLHEFLTNPTDEAMQRTRVDVHLFEPGLGVSEGVYAWSVAVSNIGGFLGGLAGGVLASTVPYWYSFLLALLFNATGFLIYAIAQQGWVMIVARLLVAVFSGLQHSLVFAYIGVSYQNYVEIQTRAGKKVNPTKYCRVKDLIFSLYTIFTSAGYFIGAGFSALLAQFTAVDHFRAIGWCNFALAVLTIVLLFVTFHGESDWRFIYGQQIKHHLKSGVNATTCSTLLILGFLLLCTGVIKSRTAVYELLFNPILADSFGFSENVTVYYFLFVLMVPVFGGLLLFLLEWSKLSNLLISILGIIASIMGLTVMCDWQAITHDPCLDYSLYHHPEFIQNLSTPEYHFPSTPCWNFTDEDMDGFKSVSNVDGHLVLFFNPFLGDNSTELNCRLHASTKYCYICHNSESSQLEMNFETSESEICYSPSSQLIQGKEHVKFSIVCDGIDSGHCVSACLNIQNPSEARIQEVSESAKHLFRHAYTQSMLLMHTFVSEAARNKCESMTQDHCHWIPDSLVAHKLCTDCLPICRGVSHTLSFVQFVVGSVWFMLTYPVAEVALPVVISDSVQKEFQGIMMGLTVAITELFQSITPLWLMVAYKSAGRRTFLPLMILIATFLPFLFGLMILYRKLVQLRETRHEDNVSADTGEEIYDLVNRPDKKEEASDHEE